MTRVCTLRAGTGGRSMGTPRGRSSERGTVLVEFALVIVLLFFVLYGIVAYGMAIALRQSMGQAAGEAVRAAVVFPGTDLEKEAEARRIADDVTDSLGKPGFSTVDADVAACATGSGSCITVVYEYAYGGEGAIVPDGPFGVILPNTLTATAVGQIVP